MILRKSLSWIFFISFFGAPAFSTVEDKVGKLLSQALEKGTIFELPEGEKKQRSNFFAFRFEMPSDIKKDPALAQMFLECLRLTVKEERLVGPDKRPLVLIVKRETKEEKPKKKKALPMSKHYSNDGMAY